MSPRGGPAPIVLELQGITKRFGGLLANDGIDLELRRGEVLALLGENGAGKTTLMSILFGHYVADAGTVRVAGPDGTLKPLPPGSPHAALAAGIGMVHQHFALASHLTAFENILLGTEPLWAWRQRRRQARERIEALMTAAGLAVPLDVPAGSLSVGERQRIEILKALYRDARMLILDEPTAVLAPDEAERLFATLARLAADGLAILFISHKLDEVMRLSQRIVVLRAGRKVAEVATAATTPAAIAEAMVGRAVALPRREPGTSGTMVLELDGVDVPMPRGISATGLTLAVRAHEILGIAGVSGNGQRALAALLAGMAPPRGGTIRLNGAPWPQASPRAVMAAGVGRVPEDRLAEGVVAELSLAENLILETARAPAFQRLGFLRRGAVRAHAERLIAAWDVRCQGPDQRIGLLSGGNIQKLLLGRVLEAEPGLLLADQPTRGLDVGAVAFVHGRLLEARRRGAAIVLISEDLDELLRLSDRIAVMHRGRLSAAAAAETVTIRELGLLMTGQDHHAA